MLAIIFCQKVMVRVTHVHLARHFFLSPQGGKHWEVPFSRTFFLLLEFLSHPIPSSRPIVHLAPSLAVTPPAISVVQRDCIRRGQKAACLSAALCFQVTSRTSGHWNHRFCEWLQSSSTTLNPLPDLVSGSSSPLFLPAPFRYAVHSITGWVDSWGPRSIWWLWPEAVP